MRNSSINLKHRITQSGPIAQALGDTKPHIKNAKLYSRLPKWSSRTDVGRVCAHKWQAIWRSKPAHSSAGYKDKHIGKGEDERIARGRGIVSIVEWAKRGWWQATAIWVVCECLCVCLDGWWWLFGECPHTFIHLHMHRMPMCVCAMSFMGCLHLIARCPFRG